MAYSGGRILLDDLLFKPEDNLVDQSLSARRATTPTNGDGFGVGWYGEGETPGLFRSIRPAWNDLNLRDLASHVKSELFLAHVRKSSLANVQETNCHPFRFGKWLFVHNGQVVDAARLRRDMLMEVAPEYFGNVLGTTDSELMFHLALTYGLDEDAPRALARMAGFVEKVARKHGVSAPIKMTLGLSDGKTLYGVRYATDGKAPSLFHSPDIGALYSLIPALHGHFGNSAYAIVSEPLGNFPECWTEVPEGMLVVVREGNLRLLPFEPLSDA